MPMHKKANGANFTVAAGPLTITFESDGPALVHVVCVWGPKPQFGGQRPKVWCSETETSRNGRAKVEIPEGMAMSGAQVTWSGGLIATKRAQGRLLVSLAQEGAEATSYAYEYSFSEKDQTESFYDGLNFA